MITFIQKIGRQIHSYGVFDGFTVTEFIDMNDNGTFENSDSLLQRDFFEPLKLEEHQSLEIAYTGVINSKILSKPIFIVENIKILKVLLLRLRLLDLIGTISLKF